MGRKAKASPSGGSPTCSSGSSSTSPSGGSFLPLISSPRPAAVLSGDVPSEAAIMRGFKKARETEREAQKRITQLKRDLQRAKQQQAEAEALQRKQEEVKAFRARLSEIRGTDIATAHAHIEPASEADVVALSELFNASLLLNTERGSSGEAAVRLTWYETFKAVDTNGSGLISFDEFKDACRKRKLLHISQATTSDSQLIALWKSLDRNGNGTIDAGEWGGFMKKGAPKAAESARTKLFALRLAHQRKLRAEIDAHSGKDLIDKLADVTPASEAELTQYSTHFHAALRRMTGPQAVDNVWYRLFRTVDLNNSGLIDFQEFEVVARELLRLVQTEVSDEQLKSLWKALDEDGSGKIDAGEFGRFMRRGEPAPPLQTPRERMHATVKEAVAKQKDDERRGVWRSAAEKAVAEELDAVAPCSAEEVTALAVLFNEQLSRLYPDKEPADVWYKCLRELRDGRIYYEDLEHMLRRRKLYDGLEFSHPHLPDAKLHSLWRALDEKGAGYITVGTFGRFMRFGARGSADTNGAAAAGGLWQSTRRLERLARDQQKVRNAKASSMAVETAVRLAHATHVKEAEAMRAMQEAQRLEEQLRAYGAKAVK